MAGGFDDFARLVEHANTVFRFVLPGRSKGSRQLDRLLDQHLTFREKLEWLEEAETLSLRLRKSREARSQENTPETL